MGQISPAIMSVMGGAVAVILYGVHNKIKKESASKMTLVKLFLMVAIIVYTITFLQNNKVLKSIQMGGASPDDVSIHVGSPNFWKGSIRPKIEIKSF